MNTPHLMVDAPAADHGGPAGHHARFAARVAHWSFSRLAEHVWVDRDDEFKVQLQLLDRQIRFVAALHPGPAELARDHQPTLDLRYLHRPGAALVDCVLVGKAYDAQDPAAAQAAARALWETAATAMPVGYELIPAQSAAQYDDWTGADIARQAREAGQWVEVRRPAEFLLWTDETQPARYLPVVYPYRWEPSGWDVVWAALARLAEPALISVSLRPLAVPAEDERVLSDLVYDLGLVAETTRSPLSERAAEAMTWYQTYLRGLRTAYAARVSVLGAPALRWTVRSALSGPASVLETAPAAAPVLQADLVTPTEAEWPAAWRNFEYLEQEPWGPNPWGRAQLLPAVDRLRFLVDPLSAVCAFRLPVLPPAGFPGVSVGQELNLGS